MKTRTRKPTYSKKFLAATRRRLTDMIESERRDYDNLAQDTLQPAVGARTGVDDVGERANEEYAEHLHAALLEGHSGSIQECFAALDRLDGIGEYTFGRCESCDDDPKHLCPTCPWIPTARLEYLPWARHCVQMQEQLESTRED